MTPGSFFLSHGGGPMPLLGDPGHQEMVNCLQQISASIPRPEAIVMVSAHWEEQVATITAGAHPPLIYDYYGFPPESYEIQYPCPGDPDLAARLQDLLLDSEISARLDNYRGFDHGMFVPMKIMYPDADIPCVQLSLLKSLDPASHIAMGAALASLADDNILLIGSGFSFHNLSTFFRPQSDTEQQLNLEFENWLTTTCKNVMLDEQQRRELLINWSNAPGARFCHPREEHLLPLHVCYGAAREVCKQFFELDILERKASMYIW